MHIEQGVVVALGHIMTFTQPATTNKDPVRTFRERTQDKFQIDATGAHDPDNLCFSTILLSGNSRQVSSSVRSPRAQKADDIWCIFKAGSHVYLLPNV